MNKNRCIALDGHENIAICKNCIEKQLEDWLKKRKPKLISSLRKKTKSFFMESKYSNNIVCTNCHKNINICDFCLRQHIKSWIEKSYPKLLAEFRLFFDLR